MRDGDRLVLPDYGGGSIVNVAASILEAFGVEPPAAPLRDELLPAGEFSGPRGTVLLVLDALGKSQLDSALASGRIPRLAQLIDSAPRGAQTITSIFPRPQPSPSTAWPRQVHPLCMASSGTCSGWKNSGPSSTC